MHKNQIKPILTDLFHHDGRGPELQKIHYFNRGIHIQAVEYYNPEDAYDEGHIKTLQFIKPEAFQFTPEEEYGYGKQGFDWSEFNKAGILNLGKTEWYKSFSNIHSSNCNHFQIMFYDEFLDIICEDIKALPGHFFWTYEIEDVFCVDFKKPHSEIIDLPEGTYAILSNRRCLSDVPIRNKLCKILQRENVVVERMMKGIERNKNGSYAVRFDLSELNTIKKGMKLQLEF
jgi:hypothetical protein